MGLRVEVERVFVILLLTHDSGTCDLNVHPFRHRKVHISQVVVFAASSIEKVQTPKPKRFFYDTIQEPQIVKFVVF